MKLVFALLFLTIVSSIACAQEVGNIVIDVPEDRIDITSGFTGKTLTVFGTTDMVGDIVVVLKGPENRVTMRKKEPVFGMWLNRSSVDFKDVPLFYSYAVSRSEHQITDAKTLQIDKIGLNALSFDAARYQKSTNLQEFQEALIRTQQAEGFFPLMPSNVRFLGQKLFRASFYLPADVPMGRYQIQAYMFRNGQIIDSRVKELRVAQTGLSGDVLHFAAEYSFLYALTGLFMAGFAGFAAFWISRRERV